jgi:hypothetical protein
MFLEFLEEQLVLIMKLSRTELIVLAKLFVQRFSLLSSYLDDLIKLFCVAVDVQMDR